MGPFSVFWFHVKMAAYFRAANGINEGLGIGFPDSLQGRPDIRAGDNGINHPVRIMAVRADGLGDGCPVLTGLMDHITDFLGILRNDEERLLLIVAIERVKGLGGYKLEDDGVQGLFPAEEIARDKQNGDIKAQDQVPGLRPALLREIDCDEIRPAAGGVGTEADTDGDTVQNSPENRNQQKVIGNHIARKQIREKTADRDEQKGEQREFFPNKAKAHINREGVQQKIHRRVRDLNMPEFLRKALNQDREPRDAAGKQSAGEDKGFNVQRKQERGYQNGEGALSVLLPIECHITYLQVLPVPFFRYRTHTV